MESQNEDSETNSKNNLKHFIERSKQRLAAILAICQWNEQDVLKNFNTNHLPNEDKIDPNDLPLPESFPSLNSVVIDRTELQNLLNTPEAENPKRFSDIQINFTREQKLLLYEYVISKTGKCSEPELTVPVLNETKNSSNDMTFAEIVAKKKREKKLRRKYRTSKPTHIEEVRNLVELQMQALEQYFKSTNKTRERRHRSRSRDRSRRNYSPMKYKNQRSYGEQSKYFGHRRRSRSCDFRDRNRRSRERTRDRSRERNYDKSRERSRTRSRRRSSKEIIQNEKIRQISSIEEERGSCVKKRKKNQIKHSKKRKSKSPKHDKKHKKKRKKEKSDKKEKTKHVEIKDEIKIKSEPESTTETE